MVTTELLKGQRFQARSTSKMPASATTIMMSTLRSEGLIFLGGGKAAADVDAGAGAGAAAEDVFDCRSCSISCCYLF